MDKDKEAMWLQFIAVCVQENVDPDIIKMRDKYNEVMYVKPRQRVLRGLLNIWGHSQTARFTGYSRRYLYNIS